MFGLRKRHSPIGLDIGAGGVRAAQLRFLGGDTSHKNGDNHRGSRGAELIAGATTPLDPSIPRDDTGRECGPFVLDLKAEAVNRCLGRTRLGAFTGRRAAVALGHAPLEFHALELPGAALAAHGSSKESRETQLASLVRWEVARLRTQPSDTPESDAADPEVRHWLLPTPSTPTANVLAVAAPRVVVDEALRLCAGAGLSCTQVDAGATALARFGSLLCAWPADAVWGILDLGYGGARLILCVRETPVLVRHAGRGGAAWTERIGQCLQLSPQSAETEKCEHGIEPPRVGQPSTRRGTRTRRDGDGASGLAHQEVGFLLFGALRNALKELAAEIKRSYEYVLSCYPRNRAADLVLVGGGSAMRNLPRYLGDVLGIPVRRAGEYFTQPMADSCRLTVPEESVSHLHLLACAIGAACPADEDRGPAEERSESVHLIARSRPERTRR